jgi:hypothetical protein
MSRAILASLVVIALAAIHCGGDDTTTPGGGAGSGGRTTGAGTQTTSVTSTTAGAGGSPGTTGTTGTGGFGGSFGDCPATRPADGMACMGLSLCPYGSTVCSCVSARGFLCVDLDGFSFDGSFGVPDGGP